MIGNGSFTSPVLETKDDSYTPDKRGVLERLATTLVPPLSSDELAGIEAQVVSLREQYPHVPAVWRVQLALHKGADRLNAAAGERPGAYDDPDDATDDTETGDLDLF